MKILIVDDDFVCRKVLVNFLKEYGECDIAANGSEAVEAFEDSLQNNEKYDLICLDIMMPEISGQDTLKKIRELELKNGITGLNCTKIIMITALDDPENIKTAFREQCEGYFIKPVDKVNLVEKLEELGLVR